jgi:hypothetical protein
METDLVKVNELIAVDSQWNISLIRSLFFAPDVESILQIPLRSSEGEDWLAWSLEKSWTYSVRSAYRAMALRNQMEDVAIGGAALSSSESNGDIWKRLWKLCVVPKVRAFWWRVLRGIISDYDVFPIKS